MPFPILVFLFVVLGYLLVLVRIRMRVTTQFEPRTQPHARPASSGAAPLLILIGLAAILFMAMLVAEVLVTLSRLA